MESLKETDLGENLALLMEMMMESQMAVGLEMHWAKVMAKCSVTLMDAH